MSRELTTGLIQSGAIFRGAQMLVLTHFGVQMVYTPDEPPLSNDERFRPLALPGLYAYLQNVRNIAVYNLSYEIAELVEKYAREKLNIDISYMSVCCFEYRSRLKEGVYNKETEFIDALMEDNRYNFSIFDELSNFIESYGENYVELAYTVYELTSMSSAISDRIPISPYLSQRLIDSAEVWRGLNKHLAKCPVQGFTDNNLK